MADTDSRPSDAQIVAVLTAAVTELASGPCTFWACPGPDAPPVGMATCRVCWQVHELRGLIARLDTNRTYEAVTS